MIWLVAILATLVVAYFFVPRSHKKEYIYIPPPPSADELIKTFETEEDETLLHLTVLELKELGQQSIPSLIKSLDSPLFKTKYYTILTLDALGSEAVEVVPKLQEFCLNESNEELRELALECALNIGIMSKTRKKKWRRILRKFGHLKL